MTRKQITYQARLIGQGKIINHHSGFQATDDLDAWNKANDGIDPLTGQWVEIKRQPKPQKRPNPATLTPKTDAGRESLHPNKADPFNHSSSAPQLPAPAGYMPGVGTPDRSEN